MLVEMLDSGHEAILEFLFGGDTDVAQHGSGELGEEAFDKIEPGAVLWREHELEAAGALLGEPVARLLGDMRRMIVEDQLDRGLRRIGAIQQLEELDELAAAMSVLDQGMHLAGEQVDPGQQADRAMALVFVVAAEGLMQTRLRRQIRRRRADRLHTRLLS